jgi:Rod binding domain-containing protein
MTAISVNPLAAASVKAPASATALTRPEANREGTGATTTDPLERTADQEKVHRAALQFEAIFLRQLLKSAKFGSNMSEGGYGGMVVEALASGVTQQGGLGLATAIEDTIMRSQLAAKKPTDP